ncbi:hypothetical protein RUND412_004297 [Rhizina undulata]
MCHYQITCFLRCGHRTRVSPSTLEPRCPHANTANPCPAKDGVNGNIKHIRRDSYCRRCVEEAGEKEEVDEGVRLSILTGEKVEKMMRWVMEVEKARSEGRLLNPFK